MASTNVKGIVSKALCAGLVLGAFVLVAPKQAQAAQWGVGVQVEQPAYAYGGYAYNGPVAYYDRDAYRDAERRQEWLEHERHEEWERRQAYLQHEYWEHERREHERWEHRRGDDDDWR